MGTIRRKYPNVKLCYSFSMIYGNYQTGTGSAPERYADCIGRAVKSFREDQVNGHPDLQYSGNGANVLWLAWDPCLWANGATLREDGLKWIFADDDQSDGVYPSITGRKKIAQSLLQFFTTDATATPWFLET
jgi:hypothetical protein